MIMTSSLLCLVALLTISFNNAQFIQQPRGIMEVVGNRPVVLNCTVDEEYVIDWNVTFFGSDSPVQAGSFIFDSLFARRNFIFTGVATTTSTVSFSIFEEDGGQTNNNTIITCIAQAATRRIPGNELQVLFMNPGTDIQTTQLTSRATPVTNPLETARTTLVTNPVTTTKHSGKNSHPSAVCTGAIAGAFIATVVAVVAVVFTTLALIIIYQKRCENKVKGAGNVSTSDDIYENLKNYLINNKPERILHLYKNMKSDNETSEMAETLASIFKELKLSGAIDT